MDESTQGAHRARGTSDGPFCWAGKSALNRIEKATDARSDRAHIMAVYFVLVRLASNGAKAGRGESEFSAPRGEIASRAGLSVRKVCDVLRFLQEIGLLYVQQNRVEGTSELAPSTYLLLACAHDDAASGTPCLTSGTICLRLGTDAKQASVPSNRRTVLNNSIEEQYSTSAAATAPANGGDEDEAIEPAQPELALASQQATQPKKSKAPRKRDPLFDSLALATEGDPQQLTSTAARTIAVKLAEIRKACPDLTADEIHRRARNYGLHFPDATMTAAALAKHWARCDKAPLGAQIQQPMYFDNSRYQKETA